MKTRFGANRLIQCPSVGGLLRPIYEDELRRLENHAKAHPPILS
jgi:hypothetical protein